jgi:hypothetical protein
MGQGQGTTKKGCVSEKEQQSPRPVRMWALLRKRKNMTRKIYNTMTGELLAETRPVSP